MVEKMAVRGSYKKTEVGVIPEDWEVVDLGRSSTLKARIGWQGLTTSEYLDSGEYFLVTGTDFKDGRIDWTDCHYVEKERYDQDINIQLKVGDILVTKDGTIGKIAYVDQIIKDTTLNSGVFVIRPLGNAYYEPYLYHIFMSNMFKDFLDKLTAGSTIIHLYQKDFVNFKFPSPNLAEQRAIAKVLTDTDNLIQSIEKLIDKKEKIKQGTMQELLTGKKRLDGFSGEWEVKNLYELVEFINGKAHENFISDIGKYIVVNSRFVSTEGNVIKYSNQGNCLALTNDILMVMSDVPNGRAIAKCYYVEEDNRYTINQRVCILRSKDVISKFLFYVVDRNSYYLSFDDGVKQTNLKRDDVLNLNIKVPPLNEQKAISQAISDMDQEIEALQQKLDKYKTIKQGMMQELLTGRIRLI